MHQYHPTPVLCLALQRDLALVKLVLHYCRKHLSTRANISALAPLDPFLYISQTARGRAKHRPVALVHMLEVRGLSTQRLVHHFNL